MSSLQTMVIYLFSYFDNTTFKKICLKVPDHKMSHIFLIIKLTFYQFVYSLVMTSDVSGIQVNCIIY